VRETGDDFCLTDLRQRVESESVFFSSSSPVYIRCFARARLTHIFLGFW